jgi:hypothetical protein
MVSVNEMVQTVASSVGWVGAAGTVGAYALVSSRRLDAHSMRFQAINIAGAGLLAVSALTAGNWPSFFSNLIWGYFGVHGLVRSRHAVRAVLANRWRIMREQWDARHRAPGTALGSDDESTPGTRMAGEVILAA